MSMFSVAILQWQGRVRIIPILRKWIPLFSPVPIGALNISAFNRFGPRE